MKRKLLVAEAVHLLDDQGAQRLPTGQPCALLRLSGGKVLRYQSPEHRMLIKKVGDGLQLFGTRQIEPRLGKCRLDSMVLAHFVELTFS